MGLEIRAARKEEMVDLRRLVGYAFADNETDPTDETNALVIPEWTTCAFVEGRLASTLAAYPFRMRLNGATVEAAGVTHVATLPRHRRQGLLRETLTQSFREQRERGQSLAILWASFGAIYQRFGYGPATNSVVYDFDPRWAGLHAGLEAGGAVSVEHEPGEALPTLKDVYRRYAGPRNLLVHRAAPMWNFGIFRSLDKKHRTHTGVYRDAAGTATGYLVYQLESDENARTPNQTLVVTDFVALDADAHIGLWQHLVSHDLVVRVRTAPMPDDDPTPLLVAEPDRLGRTLRDGLFLRVVDAERALAARPYAAEGRLAVEIRDDPLCDWNEGVFQIDADDAESQVRRISATPDLTLPPRSLATLLAGHSSASQLSRAGLLDARDPEILERADRMFATAHRPFCRDGF